MQTELRLTGNQFDWFASSECLPLFSHIYVQNDTHYTIAVYLYELFSPSLSGECRHPRTRSFGYLLGNYPDSWLLQQYPSGKVLAIGVLLRQGPRGALSGKPSDVHLGCYSDNVSSSNSSSK